MLINDVKYACATCIKGHRSSTCAHSDRELIEIKKKGRPVSQCNHCRELRRTRQVHVRCMCDGRNEAVVAAHTRSVIPSTVSPIEAPNVAAAGCECASNGGEGCTCCTPRVSFRKAQHANASSSGTNKDAKPGLNRNHTFAARTGEARHSGGLQRSISHGHHGQKTVHHHGVHFTPYPQHVRPAEGEVAIEPDLTAAPHQSAESTYDALTFSTPRPRSHSVTGVQEDAQQDSSDAPSIYTNPLASVSSPILGGIVTNQSGLFSAPPSAGLSPGGARFPGGFRCGVDSYLQMPLGDSTFAPPFPEPSPVDGSQDGTSGSPFTYTPSSDTQGFMESGQFPVDRAMLNLSDASVQETIRRLLSVPMALPAEATNGHMPSQPPSMTSRSSSRSGGGQSHDHFDFLDSNGVDAVITQRGRTTRAVTWSANAGAYSTSDHPFVTTEAEATAPMDISNWQARAFGDESNELYEGTERAAFAEPWDARLYGLFHGVNQIDGDSTHPFDLAGSQVNPSKVMPDAEIVLPTSEQAHSSVHGYHLA